MTHPRTNAAGRACPPALGLSADSSERVHCRSIFMSEHQPAAASDLVTQIQDHLNGLCSMFFNFAGALQRDAAPARVSDEPLAEPSASRPKHDVKGMATQLAQASKQLDKLIEQLPFINQTEQEQLQHIAQLKVLSYTTALGSLVLRIAGLHPLSGLPFRQVAIPMSVFFELAGRK